MREQLALLIGLFYFIPATQLQAGSIFIEGENARVRQNRPHSWYDQVKKDELSGGAWISHFDKNRAGFLVYTFRATHDGRYVFWIRANHVHSSLSYRLNDKRWIPIDLTQNQIEPINVALDEKPDLRFLAWVKVGGVLLHRGVNKLDFRMDSPSHNHGAIDCFCFTTDDWVPSGKQKPGDRLNWPVSTLTDENLPQWRDFIRPSEDELKWRSVRWHQHLSEAAEEAKVLQRPILLWTMNGHPCGET